jgi:hypothetical protein
LVAKRTHSYGTCAIVVNTDEALLGVDDDLERVHLGVTLFVVGGIDQNLVKDLVETRNITNAPLDHANTGIVHPNVFFLGLQRALEIHGHKARTRVGWAGTARRQEQ